MLITASEASAGDTASLDLLGYSPDGKVFAFEEYGIADGSGFPYSNIYFIDIAEDKFLPGTPIRVRLDDEGSLGIVREKARAKAAALATRYKVDDNPGVFVAYNPPSEIDSDPYSVRFLPYVSISPYDFKTSLVLTVKDFPASDTCYNHADTNKGFMLKLTEYRGQKTDQVAHDDDRVPESRGCVSDYRIGAVVASEIQEMPLIAMILVGTFGFEGEDRRWIAVPINTHGP